ncbi:MAG: alpha/beta hydrolase [Firmicutes bacterium]|nr:alpha/beta hydrolase [Bacillota bacterium]
MIGEILTRALMRLLILSPWVISPPWWTPRTLYAFRPASAGPYPWRLEKDLVYDRRPEGPLRLDLYLPVKVGENLPAVLMIHGGGWVTGSKSSYRGLGRLLAGHGFAAAAFDYRLLTEAPWSAPLEDCLTALSWLRSEGKRWGLDSERITLLGDSAGAHLAAMLALEVFPSIPIRGVIAYYGPFLLTEPALPGWPRRCQEKLLGGPLEKPAVMERAKALSPVHLVSRTPPPFLLVHGELDSVVPFRSSELMAEALRTAGGEAQLVAVKGAEHGLFSLGRPSPSLIEIDRRTIAFLTTVTGLRNKDEEGKEQKKVEKESMGVK